MAWLDWAVMALYGLVVLAIGWWANRRQKDTEDYFLGGRRLRWWVVGISLVATSFSSVSLVGGTQYGFNNGMLWLQLQIGDLFALLLVCVVFLPFFSRMRLTTAYEYLEHRFGVRARTVASALFIAQTLLRTSILVFVPASVLAGVVGWSIELAIVVSAAAAILYSAFGGIGAVVWTDLIQMVVILFAVVYSLLLVASDVPGGFSALIDHASESGKLRVVNLELNRGVYSPFGTMVAYLVFAASLFGTGQQAVQRFLSCRDLKSARRAAMLGWGVGTVALGLSLFLGVCLAGWNHLAPGVEKIPEVGVLSGFMTQRLPMGMTGLMFAAIFAASMSSIDSAIHSMSTATIVDFVRRFSKKERNELVIARWTTAGFGGLAVFGAMFAAHQTGGILETLITWLGYFAGPLLGLFLLGMLTKRTTEVAALGGVGAAFAGVVVVVLTQDPKPWGFHPLWLAPASCAVTMLTAAAWPRGSRPDAGSSS